VRKIKENYKTAPTVCENLSALETNGNKNKQNTVKPARRTLVGSTQLFKTCKNIQGNKQLWSRGQKRAQAAGSEVEGFENVHRFRV
jgi:hypothetical protein